MSFKKKIQKASYINKSKIIVAIDYTIRTYEKNEIKKLQEKILRLIEETSDIVAGYKFNFHILYP